jgi:hypothetical protein
MKKKLLILGTLLVFILPLSSFKVQENVMNTKVKKRHATIEFGDFVTGGVVYGVYGDAGTNNITSVTELYANVAVNSYTATYDGSVINITGYNAHGQYFSYYGRLVWA